MIENRRETIKFIDTMKIMFFDTETGGKDAKKCDILQLSYQIVEFPTFNFVKTQNFYFKRDRPASVEAINVNGLTDEFLAMQVLTPRNIAIKEFLIDLSECFLLVAHCIQFDQAFIRQTCRRTHYTKRYDKVFSKLQTYDTMKETADLCRLPFTAPRNYQKESRYKYPRLSELADFLNIDRNDINLHDSDSDVTLTIRCFAHLVEMGWINLQV